MKLGKLVIPLIKRNIIIFIAMILISSLGISLLVGLRGAHSSLKNTIDTYLDDYKYPDITINFDICGKTKVKNEELLKIDGVESVTKRLSMELSVTHNNTLLSARASSIDIDSFSKYETIKEIKKNDDYINIYVDNKFAEYNNINLGDILNVSFFGVSKNIYVSKIITSPECMAVYRNNYGWIQTRDYGYLYTDTEELRKVKIDGYCNQASFIIKDGYDKEEVLKSITESLGFSYNSYTLYEDSMVSKNISTNIDPLKSLSIITPTIFFIICLFVNILFLYKLIYRYRKEIGVILTMGHSKLSIFILFSILSFIISIPASIIGLGIGYSIEIITNTIYKNHFDLPYLLNSLDLGSYFISSLLTIALCALASIISTILIISNKSIVRIMNGSPKSNYKFNLNVSPRVKIEISRYVRNIKVFIISTVIISLSTAIIFAGFAFKASKEVMLDDVFNKRLKYDAQVFITEKNEAYALNGFRSKDYVNSAEPLYYLEANIKNGDNDILVLINGIDINSKLIGVIDNHKEIKMPSDGIVLSNDSANKLGVKIGDYVTIFDKEVKVSAISELDVMRIEYMNKELLKELTDSYILSIILNTSNKELLKEYSSNRDDFALITFKDVIKDATIDSIKIVDVGTYVLASIGVLIGILFIFNISNITFEEEKRIIGIKRSLGFSILSISNDYFIELIIKFLLSSTIGIFIGKLITIVGFKGMETKGVNYPVVGTNELYLTTLVVVFIFMLISHLITIRRVKNINLVQILNEK